MQIPSYPVYRWFFIHCLCDSLGAAVLRPVASLCQCNCVQLLVVFLACSGGSQTLAFRKKTVYPWLSRFACWKPAVANLFYDTRESLASQSQIAPALGFRWIFNEDGVNDHFVFVVAR